jgi:acetylornithine aminotransferase
VIRNQSEELIHTGYIYAHQVIEESAIELLETMGLDDGKGVFLCSGSEAIEFGVRLAQKIMDRPFLLSMSDSYYGAYGSATTRDAGAWTAFDWLDRCKTCPKTEVCDRDCTHFQSIPFNQLGGFLFEPGSSSGFVRFPPKGLVRLICETIQSEGGLVLVNEITTGIGRTGRWYGFEHYGIKPDIVAIGKGIGNGYPVSFTGISKQCVDCWEGRPFPYAQSHQYDPLGARVALEVVRVIKEEGLIDRARNEGIFLKNALEGLKTRYSMIQEVRGRGLMLAIDLDQAQGVFEGLLANRFILSLRLGGKTLRLDPCLNVNRQTLERFLVCLESLLKPGNAIEQPVSSNP